MACLICSKFTKSIVYVFVCVLLLLCTEQLRRKNFFFSTFFCRVRFFSHSPANACYWCFVFKFANECQPCVAYGDCSIVFGLPVNVKFDRCRTTSLFVLWNYIKIWESAFMWHWLIEEVHNKITLTLQRMRSLALFSFVNF